MSHRSGTVLLILLLLVGLPALVCQAAQGDIITTRTLQEPVFGGQVYVREAGNSNAEILLLVHGIGDQAGQTWEPLIAELAQDYHVVVPDLPGFGRSAKGNHLYSPQEYARFLDWLVNRLPDKSLNLVGHSLGGGISLVYTAYHGQRLKRLVLIDSVGVLHYLAVSQNYVQTLALDEIFAAPVSNPLGRIASLLLEKTSRLPLDPEVILNSAFLRRKFLAEEPTRIAGLALAVTDYSLLLGQIEVPTWLIWGEEDNIAPVRIGRVLDWMVPNSQLIVMPEVGHVPMSEQPDQLRNNLLQALRQEPKKEPWSNEQKHQKVALCKDDNGVVLEGVFDEIQIVNCKNVLLKHVTATRVLVQDSDVRVESSRFSGRGAQAAFNLLRSRVTMTAVDINGATGVITDQSRLDFAGVRFIDTETAIVAQGNPSALLCSSSTRSNQGQLSSLHLSRSLQAGEEL